MASQLGTVGRQDPMVAECAAVSAALLEASSNLAAEVEPLAVVRSACEGMVAATAHIRLAWAWLGDPETTLIRPMISIGPAKAYAGELTIEKNLLTMHGPVFRVLATNEPETAASSRFSLFGPWRAANKQHGLEVAAAFPLHVPDASERGLLVIYADQPDYFDQVGLQPFAAFVRLAEAALAQADARAQLQQRATHDSLTGLPNRDRVKDELANTHANAQRYGWVYALLMFDIDNFKEVNDTFGHDAGDRAIDAVSRAARVAMRRGDTVGRWGGDEFLAILPQANADAAVAVAERLRAQMNAIAIDVAGTTVHFRASYGIAVHPTCATSVRELLSAVDKALYQAKHDGGDIIRRAPAIRRQ